MDKQFFSDLAAQYNDIDALDRVVRRIQISAASAFYDRAAGIHLVQARRLYRQKYNTFEEWCVRDLELSESQAYNYIAAYRLLCDMHSLEWVTILPTKERHTRIINQYQLNPLQFKLAWSRVQERVRVGESFTTTTIVEEFDKEIRQYKETDPEGFAMELSSMTWDSPKESAPAALESVQDSFYSWKCSPLGDGVLPSNKLSGDVKGSIVLMDIAHAEMLSPALHRVKENPHWIFMLNLAYDYDPELSGFVIPDNALVGSIVKDNDDQAKIEELVHLNNNTFAIYRPEEIIDIVECSPTWVILEKMTAYMFFRIYAQLQSHPCVYIPDGVVVPEKRYVSVTAI